MGDGGVAAAFVGAIVYVGLGLFGASRIWASRFSASVRDRSPYLIVLSAVMNVVAVAMVFAQMATRSSGRRFPCGVTSTASYLYILLCALPLVLRSSGDTSIWTKRISPQVALSTLSKVPLLATRQRYAGTSTSPGGASSPSSAYKIFTDGDDEENSHGSRNSAHDPRIPAAAFSAFRYKLTAVAVVVTTGAVTALSVVLSGGSWSVRTDGSCFPMESWHLLASWAACSALGASSFAGTVDPEKPEPRNMRRGPKIPNAGALKEQGSARTLTAGKPEVALPPGAEPWWLWLSRWRRPPCLLRREKLFMALVSVWFGGVYVAMLSGQPDMTMAGGNALLALLIIMNAFLLLSTFWVPTLSSMRGVKPLTPADLAKLQKKWGSTKNIMNDATVAAKFRDAAKAHFCEELYKFLAAFQEFELLNVDEVADGRGSLGHTHGSRISSLARSSDKLPQLSQLPELPRPEPCRSYQVARYSTYVGIIGEFFLPGCRHEVNVSSDTRRQVSRLLNFRDWVASSEADKRNLFQKAAQEVRMILDQNITGNFICSRSFECVARHLIKAHKNAREDVDNEAEDQQESTARQKVRSSFHSIAVAHTLKNRWAKVAADQGDIEEGDVETSQGVPTPSIAAPGSSTAATEMTAAKAGAADAPPVETLPTIVIHVSSAQPDVARPVSPLASFSASATSSPTAKLSEEGDRTERHLKTFRMVALGALATTGRQKSRITDANTDGSVHSNASASHNCSPSPTALQPGDGAALSPSEGSDAAL